uniref:Uncharacterized protein n=1 Tax=Arundo donax TaxID=35708 RepID=A0A0A9B9J7_ARUDO
MVSLFFFFLWNWCLCS